jgi:acyl-CoA thioester hydrolase
MSRPDDRNADRALYPHWHMDRLRFSDLDRQDHVNNAVFSTLFESGRVATLDRVIRPLIGPAAMFALVRLTIDFRREMRFPGDVDIGTRIIRVGGSSLTFGQALFLGETCTATAEAITVHFDRAAGKGVPLPDSIRALDLTQSR